jgi:hypothetical protein
MKIAIPAISVFFVLVFLFTGCVKTESFYYADQETPGLGIFSNTGNNVLTCFIGRLPWQTIARTTGGFFTPDKNEVYITRQKNANSPDMLSIQWRGYYSGYADSEGDITLYYPIAKDFRLTDLSAWQGKRLTIDGINSYFFAEISPINQRGPGTIYFNVASFDSTAFGYRGKMSGLMEADFGAYSLSSGRFDHTITADQVNFY